MLLHLFNWIAIVNGINYFLLRFVISRAVTFVEVIDDKFTLLAICFGSEYHQIEYSTGIHKYWIHKLPYIYSNKSTDHSDND